MKLTFKSILMSMFAVAALTSCNNDDESVPVPSTGHAELDGGYITVDIPRPAATRAATGPETDNGTEAESDVANVYVATFDANYFFANYYQLELLKDQTSYLAKTAAIKLSKGAKYMVVVLNAPKEVVDKLKAASTATSFDDIKAVVKGLSVGQVTTPHNFTMVSAGDLTQLEGSNGLTKIVTTYETADEAEEAANRIPVSVDRIVAKFQITNMTPTTKNVKGGTYTPIGWALNVENKATTLYSELITFGGTNEDPKSRYRMDHNWAFESKFDTVPVNKDDLAAYRTLIDNNFKVLYNHKDSIAKIIFNGENGTADKLNTWQYLFENTMSDQQQKVDRTTNIIFKAKYTPNTVSKNADGTETVAPGDGKSYFKYAGRLYNFEGVQAVYALAEKSLAAANDTINNPKATADGLKEAQANKAKAETVIADFNKVATAVLGDKEKNVFKTWKDDVKSLDVLDNVANGGNLAELCKLRYYQKGINFYRGVIKHDYRLGTLALGKFGVVRNNAYSLSVESIAGTGEPWIPVATVPEGELPGGGGDITLDEEPEANIAVTITVNPWTTWSQGFEM